MPITPLQRSLHDRLNTFTDERLAQMSYEEMGRTFWEGWQILLWDEVASSPNMHGLVAVRDGQWAAQIIHTHWYQQYANPALSLKERGNRVRKCWHHSHSRAHNGADLQVLFETLAESAEVTGEAEEVTLAYRLLHSDLLTSDDKFVLVLARDNPMWDLIQRQFPDQRHWSDPVWRGPNRGR